MRIETISIPTDTESLEGLLYLPDGDVRGAVQLFHGNTMNFYVGPPRFLPPHLTERGFACLAYNRRGHDVLSNRDSRDLEGGAFQTISEAIEDNRLARAWLDERGFPPPVAIGHSHGGMLAVRHVADHPDTPALMLLSAHRGSSKMLRLMADNGLMASDRYEEITAEARRLVDEGRGGQLLVVPGWWYVISANTYVDLLDNCPDIVEFAGQIPCDTLYLRSIEEPPSLYPGELIADSSPMPVSMSVSDFGGHYYLGHEDQVASEVTTWLTHEDRGGLR
ncbi:MAG: alpha/beta fold hydrolase [Acidimicrobiia bacterium]|nr:alpha/beta fold hydrolase [Acidimicrobiia bacterium]